MALEKCPFKKQLDEFREIFNPITKLTDISRKGLSFFTLLGREVSDITSKTIGATQFLSVVNGVLFNVPKTIGSIIKAFTASKYEQRVQSMYDTCLNALGVFSDAANGVRALNVVGAIGKQLWTASCGKILYPFSCVNFGTHIHNMVQFAAFYDKLKERVFDKTKKGDIENAIEVCEVLEEKVSKIEKKLGLSREARIKEQAEGIRERLSANESAAIDDLKVSVSALRDRITLKTGFHITDTALKIAGVITSGFLIFGTATPFIGGTVLSLAVAGFILSSLENVLLPKNPFDEGLWQNKVVAFIKEAHVRIQDLFFKAAPAR